MVVDDGDIECISVSPTKADAPLVVDPNAVVAGAIATELLQPIARWDPQIVELRAGIELDELASRHPLQLPRPLPHGSAAEDPLRVPVGEGLDHALDLNGYRY